MPEKANQRVGAAWVAEQTAKAIERGEYAPGQRLREQELADRYGLSRSPVREGLRILESQGLVIVEEMRGARVVRPDDASFYEIMLIRAGLAGVIAELAAKASVSDRKWEFLDAARALADLAHRGGDADLIYKGLRTNNRLLDQIADAPRAKSMLFGLSPGREAFRILALRTKARRVRATLDWVNLAQAVADGDVLRARRSMNALYQRSLGFVMRELAADPRSLRSDVEPGPAQEQHRPGGTSRGSGRTGRGDQAVEPAAAPRASPDRGEKSRQSV